MNRGRDPRLQTLSTIDVLAGSSRRDLEVVCGLTTEVRIAAGQKLCRQGALANEVFLVVDGDVAVARDGVPVGLVTKGGLIGEMGVVGRARRSATTTALTDVTILVLSTGEFSQLLQQLPQVAANVRALSARRSEELLLLDAA